ncbi:alpha/beta hydrolase [Actinomycetospora sp. NBRC 106375]|uniref:alpha/beta hydrolase n=1 Tax=Actinomycetospora sp. NBRC 106375 TaxID=3032207 RepID=UPI0024A3EA98|nr:alpha/beta fold hydrolase [Actinomycetospora sp. NBRC 106375]GLZ45259.1 alpha/beta hydrolase [Actinomycetospora sp. NBRC 106375]
MTLPRLDRVRPATRRPVSAAVLVLHGGSPDNRRPADGLRLPYLRMVPFARSLAAAGARRGVDVALLRYRYRGWNAPDLDPVQDARWALRDVRARHGDVPVVLVGHSMGGRAALRVGGDEGVVGVAGLAPWIERGEPYAHLAGQAVLIAHGDRERMTDPRASLRFAQRVATVSDRVARFDVHGDGHAMLRRAAAWHDLVTHFALGALGLEPFTEAVAKAMAAGDPEGLEVPLEDP